MASGSKEKKTFHAAAFSVFLIVSTLIFLSFFYFVCKKRDAADMLVLPYYSDVSNANLDYVLK